MNTRNRAWHTVAEDAEPTTTIRKLLRGSFVIKHPEPFTQIRLTNLRRDHRRRNDHHLTKELHKKPRESPTREETLPSSPLARLELDNDRLRQPRSTVAPHPFATQLHPDSPQDETRLPRRTRHRTLQRTPQKPLDPQAPKKPPKRPPSPKPSTNPFEPRRTLLRTPERPTQSPPEPPTTQESSLKRAEDCPLSQRTTEKKEETDTEKKSPPRPSLPRPSPSNATPKTTPECVKPSFTPQEEENVRKLIEQADRLEERHRQLTSTFDRESTFIEDQLLQNGEQILFELRRSVPTVAESYYQPQSTPFNTDDSPTNTCICISGNESISNLLPTPKKRSPSTLFQTLQPLLAAAFPQIVKPHLIAPASLLPTPAQSTQIVPDPLSQRQSDLSTSSLIEHRSPSDKSEPIVTTEAQESDRAKRLEDRQKKKMAIDLKDLKTEMEKLGQVVEKKISEEAARNLDLYPSYIGVKDDKSFHEFYAEFLRVGTALGHSYDRMAVILPLNPSSCPSIDFTSSSSRTA
ncbi:hypothetical protein QR680_016067 [Steinernema hermaphroditum]|uniref:Uncharacterized protein n=1 Tax=Steinernema hermaphroditum TaxID=289476 RepID=A0AA39H9Y6_9BILA|nr:hypothetical protein QR680_016067 [Steinernema hermaphroditum]